MDDAPCDDPNILPVHGELQAEGELALEHVQPQVIRDDGVQIHGGDLNKRKRLICIHPF